MGKAGGLLLLICTGVVIATYVTVATPGQHATENATENVSAKNLVETPERVPQATHAPIRSTENSQSKHKPAQDLNATTDSLTAPVREALTLAAKLDQVSSANVQYIDAQVNDLAARLTPEDAKQLQQIATEPGQNHNSRNLAVFLMAQNPEKFAPQLESVASSPSAVLGQVTEPHSQDEVQKRFEEALRAQALQALDRLNEIDGREKDFFRQLHQTHANAFMRKLARMGEVGAEQRKSLIDQYLNNDKPTAN